MYRIGSISKQFTAAAILLLAEQDKLALDDTLGKYFEDYPEPGRDATIRQLLQHTSGIKNFTALPAYRGEQPNNVTREEVIGRFREEPLDFSPGEKFKYCNSGYFLLGAIVEEASRQSFREFVEESVFAPAQLKQTYCDNHAQIIPLRASGYSRWTGTLRNAGYLNMEQTVGAGNLASTVGDLLKWQQALNRQTLLNAESSQLMRTVGELNNNKPTSYGLGLFVHRRNGHDVIRHGGGINGFRSELAYYPDSGYCIAVLSNSENAQATRIADGIAKRLLKPSDSPQP